MGAKLPPGEAERRAAERKRRTWAGENYDRYDPKTEGGYGSYKSWADAAAAFLNGEGVEFIDSPPKPRPHQASRPQTRNPLLVALDLNEMPTEFAVLKSAYRRCVMAAFRMNGSSDTDPAYVSAFMDLTKAYDKLKAQKGWT